MFSLLMLANSNIVKPVYRKLVFFFKFASIGSHMKRLLFYLKNRLIFMQLAFIVASFFCYLSACSPCIALYVLYYI